MRDATAKPRLKLEAIVGHGVTHRSAASLAAPRPRPAPVQATAAPSHLGALDGARPADAGGIKGSGPPQGAEAVPTMDLKKL